MRKWLGRVLGAGAIAGAGYAVWRSFERRKVGVDDSSVAWETQPFPYPPKPSARVPQTAPGTGNGTGNGVEDASTPWVDPVDEGTCPVTHPVKAKLTSGIFHVEGGANYPRTRPDRCYASPEAAEADGLRAAKR